MRSGLAFLLLRRLMMRAATPASTRLIPSMAMSLPMGMASDTGGGGPASAALEATASAVRSRILFMVLFSRSEWYQPSTAIKLRV